MKGMYPWTNLDNINLDWFINEFFNLCNFVKRMAKDNENMKAWVLKNVKPVAVVAELVKATQISEEDKSTIRDNLGIKEGGEGKVKDVTVDGNSVVNDNGVAEIVTPDVPVKDVTVDGNSVVNDGVAKIVTPDVPVKAVKVGSETEVIDGVVIFSDVKFKTTSTGAITTKNAEIARSGILGMTNTELVAVKEKLGILSTEGVGF